MWSGSKAQAAVAADDVELRAGHALGDGARVGGRRHEAIAGADDGEQRAIDARQRRPSSRSRRARASGGRGRCARSRARSRRLRRRCRSAGGARAGGRRRGVEQAHELDAGAAAQRVDGARAPARVGDVDGEQHERVDVGVGMAREVRERDVAEQAVADAGQRQRREARAREGDQRRHVVLDEIVVAPVAAVLGARAALAVAAQIGDDAGDAARGQRARPGRGRAGDRACGGRPSWRGRRRRRRRAAAPATTSPWRTQPSAQATANGSRSVGEAVDHAPQIARESAAACARGA